MNIITINDLSFRYALSAENSLNGVSLEVAEGEFLVICGRSGCGKTTLLRQLKPQLAPHGERGGEILFLGEPLAALPERQSAAEIGFVMQSPEDQTVTDKVWHELAFGTESLGLDSASMRRRVAETASFFGIQNLFRKNTSELSGGQKQLIALASVMVTRPKLLILDEPTSSLDPIAASELLSVLKKLNTELGTTVILTEHRLEEALPLASRVAVMENGRILCSGSAAEVGEALRERGSGMFLAMPAAMRIRNAVDSKLSCPVSVNEGRAFLEKYLEERGDAVPLPCPVSENEERRRERLGAEMISLRGAWFGYSNEPDVIRGADVSARAGELLSVLGGNGVGKTTLLRLLAGIKKPSRGKRTVNGKVCMLPQDPRVLFSKNTLYDELRESASDMRLSGDEARQRISEVLAQCALGGLEGQHPYDLSGGEQQRAALAKLLLLEPDILLADEPTKGMDAEFKAEFAALLRGMLQNGVCIVMVSHDIEFCAEHADRCALFFDGSIAAEDEPRGFFADNGFYTTAARRISRGMISRAVTVRDVSAALGGSLPEGGSGGVGEDSAPRKFRASESSQKASEKRPLPLWRRIGAAIFGIAAAVVYFIAAKTESFGEMLTDGGVNALGARQLLFYGAVLLCAAAAAAFCGAGRGAYVRAARPRKLPKRTAAAIAVTAALVPLTLWTGAALIPQRQYYVTALLLLAECMAMFLLAFEGRRPRARELVTVAVLCALAIAGRAAFFMLPQFKPILAVAVISGAAFGGETGFLVGSLSMLVSNMMFAQGPWTPWQMFAAGLVGAVAGLLCRTGLLRRSKTALCVYGALAALVLYGGIMNPASALLWSGGEFNAALIMSSFVTGLPMDCVHAAATALFLWFLAEPLLERLERVRGKFGLGE